MNLASSFIDYLKESQKELKKVNWPSRQQTVKYSIIVIAMSLGLAAFLGGIDYVFNYILNNFIIK